MTGYEALISACANEIASRKVEMDRVSDMCRKAESFFKENLSGFSYSHKYESPSSPVDFQLEWNGRRLMFFRDSFQVTNAPKPLVECKFADRNDSTRWLEHFIESATEAFVHNV